MSQIKMLRLNAYDPVARGVEFYFKVEDETKNSVICNFCIADEGIYYYRKRSKILSHKETERARETPNGFISMETLLDLFETLIQARLARREEFDEGRLAITKQGKSVTIALGKKSKD